MNHCLEVTCPYFCPLCYHRNIRIRNETHKSCLEKITATILPSSIETFFQSSHVEHLLPILWDSVSITRQRTLFQFSLLFVYFVFEFICHIGHYRPASMSQLRCQSTLVSYQSESSSIVSQSDRNLSPATCYLVLHKRYANENPFPLFFLTHTVEITYRYSDQLSPYYLALTHQVIRRVLFHSSNK